MTTPHHGTIAPLPESECRELLETTTVGNLAFVDADGQQLIPVNFVMIDGEPYFRTLPDGLLSSLANGHDDVAFGIGHHDLFGIGWNVTVHGSAHEVVDSAAITRALTHPRLKPWAGGDRSLVVRVSPRSIAGRRVARRWDPRP